VWIDRRCQGHARASSALQAAAIRQERAWALTAFAGDDVCAAARTTARGGASRAAARAGVVEDERLDEPLARRGQHETVEGGRVKGNVVQAGHERDTPGLGFKGEAGDDGPAERREVAGQRCRQEEQVERLLLGG
jgi:hypothetical protein